MNFDTVGSVFHKSEKLPLKYVDSEVSFEQELGNVDTFLLIYIYEGSGVCECGDKVAVVNSPSVICLDEKNRIQFRENRKLKADIFYFHPALINNIYNFENIRSSDRDSLSRTAILDLYYFQPFLESNDRPMKQIMLGPATANRVSELINSVKNELNEQKDSFWPCRSRSYFLELLFLLTRLNPISDENHEEILSYGDSDIDSIILFLHNNYNDKITIKDLCERFHYNRTTLMQRFLETTGTTIMSYLINLRLRLAALMLRDTTLQVSEIAGRVGFDDLTHFGRSFKKHMNCTPTEYRKKHNCRYA